ncbi:MAG: HPP family protein [Planctomycetes bacterium]|nr:HPP family protein [Planctomycetota bacterium]
MPQANKRITLRTRWIILRAQWSMPALLSHLDESKVVSITTAMNGAVAIFTIGFFAWLTNLPLIFPALGPSAFILFSKPLSTAAAPRNVILGHWMSLLCGWVSWWGISKIAGHPVGIESGGWSLFLSASVALALSSLFMIRISCAHPPACSSSLIVALGLFSSGGQVLIMGAVVIWLTYQAVIMNHWAGILSPIWAPRHIFD